MNKITNLLIAIVAVCLPSLATAASFDCTKAKSSLEIIICSDSALSQLDENVGNSYAKLRSRVPIGSQESINLLNEQRTFLKVRTKNCPIPFSQYLSDSDTGKIIACLRQEYSMRLDSLDKRVVQSKIKSEATNNVPAPVPTTAAVNSAPNTGSMDGKEVLQKLQQLPSAAPLPPENKTSSFWSDIIGGASAIFSIAFILFFVFWVSSKELRQRVRLLEKRLREFNAHHKKLVSAVIFFVIVFAITYAILPEDHRTPQEKTQDEACSENWKLCGDNEKLIDNTNWYAQITSACTIEAKKRSQYGEAKFPFLSFSNYRAGRDYIDTGIVLMREPNAQYQNMYDAYEHISVSCLYDLNQHKVQNILIGF